MKVLVLGGTGKVGSAAVAELANRGVAVRVLSRRAASLSVPAGVEVVGGDLEDAGSLEAALAGIDRAALVPPLHPKEGEILLRCVHAAAKAGLDRFALVSVFGLEGLPDAVHLTGKRAAEAEIDRLGLPAVVLRPNNFFQNDLAALPAIAHGAYPIPLGPVGCHPVDTRDVGAALARTLLADDGAGSKPPMVGAEALTGAGAADIWSRALGREVRYVSDDLDGWAAGMRAHAPAWLVDNLYLMYRYVAEHGLLASAEEIADTERLLGRPARRYEDFVAEASASIPA